MSKRTLRSCIRLRELEARNKDRDAYECACSISIVWPFKIHPRDRSATLLGIMTNTEYESWHLDAMAHCDLDNKPMNKSIVRMSSKAVADELRDIINRGFWKKNVLIYF